MSYESVLNESTFTHEKPDEQDKQKDEEEDDREEQEDSVKSISFGGPGFVSRVQSRTLHSVEEFNPVDDGSEFRPEKVKLVSAIETGSITDKQYALLVRNGIDDTTLSRADAQKLVGSIAQNRFRIGSVEKSLLRKIYNGIKNSSALQAPGV